MQKEIDYSQKIKEIHKQEVNSECFDCFMKGTTYFVPNFGTFVCTKCAGILRELNFKVKGISVSHFNEKEYKIASLIGNKIAKKIYLYHYDNNKANFDDKTLKKFLKDKYIKKKYFNKNKEYKQLKILIDEDSDDSEESENSESGSEEGEYSEESEESEGDEEEESEEEKCSKYQLTKICEMNIKKPTPINEKEIKNFEEVQKEKEQWGKLWANSDAVNRPINVKDFEFVHEHNHNNKNNNDNNM